METVQEYVQLVNDDFKKARAVIKEAEFWIGVLKNAPDLKFEVVLNKSLPGDILSMLAKDEDDRIRSFVAMKRSLPHEVFHWLSCDENESVRMAIARNPKTPADILEKMKNDSWSEIRNVITERLRS
jgi:hypothetical protein